MTDNTRRPVSIEIDMTPGGQFTGPPEPSPLATRVLRAAIIAGVLTIAAGLVALTLWVALALIPIILGVGVVAYLAIRFQLWRGGGRYR